MTQGQPPVTDVFRWIKLLQDHEDEVKSKLTEPQAATFGTGVRQLTDDLRTNPGNSGELGAEFVQFVGQYQPVDQWLQEKDQGFRAFRAGPEPAQAGSYVPPDPATDPAAAPGGAEPWYTIQDGRPSEDRTRIVGVPINGQQQPEQTGQE